MPLRAQKSSKSLRLYSKITAFLLASLISVICVAIIGGLIKTLIDLRQLFYESLEVALRQTIINTLVIFALVELLRTAINYLKEGRVRVTFIIDTVLIIMFNEVISFWFRENKIIPTFIILITIVCVLMGCRFLAIRYSPDID